jgi:DNA replication protein DnaC
MPKIPSKKPPEKKPRIRSPEQTRSIKYQLTVAKLPLAKDIDDFLFVDTPINESLVRDLAGGNFIAEQRNVVLVGGTGTRKTHLAIAIARACIRRGSIASRQRAAPNGPRRGRSAHPQHPLQSGRSVLGAIRSFELLPV